MTAASKKLKRYRYGMVTDSVYSNRRNVPAKAKTTFATLVRKAPTEMVLTRGAFGSGTAGKISRGSRTDFLTDLCKRLVYQTKVVVNSLVNSPAAAAIILLAALVTISYQANNKDNLLVTFAMALKQFKMFTTVAGEIILYPQRVMGAMYHLGVTLAVTESNRILTLAIGLISLLMFKSALENALVAFAVYAFLTVKDKELRFIAILVSSVYGYYTLASTAPAKTFDMGGK